MIRTTLLALTVAALLNPFSSAGAPPAPAATAPATTKPQQKIVVPPGFEVVAANGRSAIVEPADKQWVTDVLNKLPAQTKPATLPTTLLQRVSTNREPIIRQLPDQPGDVPRTYVDVDKARRLLGYEPQTPLADGIRKYVAWVGAEA